MRAGAEDGDGTALGVSVFNCGVGVVFGQWRAR